MVIYKVVEVSSVTEDVLADVLNEWTPLGWRFDGMQLPCGSRVDAPPWLYDFHPEGSRATFPSSQEM